MKVAVRSSHLLRSLSRVYVSGAYLLGLEKSSPRVEVVGPFDRAAFIEALSTVDFAAAFPDWQGHWVQNSLSK